VAEKNDVSSYLVRLLSSSQRPLKGSELSILVKTSFPGFSLFDFGCRNLREFIRKYTPDEIEEQGKAGMDIIYAARSPEQQPLFEPKTLATASTPSGQSAPLRQLLTNPRIWKTFVTPGMPFRLFFDPATGQIRVLRPEYSTDPSWVEIPRMSAEKLLQIARDFIDELPEPQRGPLSAYLEKPKWWIPYFEFIKTLGLTRRWIPFRRRRIAEEFERSLPVLPASTPIEEVSKPSVPNQLSPAVALLPSIVPDSSLKRVAVDVVQRMNDSELRSLNLPLGYVLDALKAR
jgi:hypothetical protein